jgi:K+-transporting ATPase ATPase A chain
MSYLTQMLGLTVQNFVSAAAGMASAVAMIRGFSRQTTESIGNFWVDLTRSILYILLPLSVVLALLLASQGVVQTLGGYVRAETLEGKPQVIAVGPAASQVAIKQLGTNGGGFFNANSAHPLENPTPFSNFLEVGSIILIAVGFAFMLGHMMKDRRLGLAFFSAMGILFLIGLAVVLWAEWQGNPLLAQAGVAGGVNMEGKEVRNGIVQSALWAQTTTATSNGSVNAMHDSMMPLTGLILLFNMAVGEVVFGGVGVGLIGILFHAIIAMFLAGLMIGRTPELLNKKLEPMEMIMAVIAVVAPGGVLLALAAVAVSTSAGLSSLANSGSHGLSEILYAFASPLGNNGSAFAGLNANTVFYNLMTGFGMLVERFATILPALAIAGFLARKRTVPQSTAMFPTASPIFVVLLVSVVIVFGALTFFPAFALGPFLEHLMVLAGKTF